MNRFIIFWITCLLLPLGLYAKAGKTAVKPTGYKETENTLIDKIINCLQYKDSVTYSGIFPAFDTIWEQIEAYKPLSPEDAGAIDHIRQYPARVKQFDPFYNPEIVANFYKSLVKGETLGIHWNSIILARFELQKLKLTRDLVGYEKIAEERFRGYVFIQDVLSRKVYCFTVNEMQHIHNYWYGGQVINLFEAANVEEYQKKLAEENKRKQMMQEFGLTEQDLARLDSMKHAGKKDNAKITDHLVITEQMDEDEEAAAHPIGIIKKGVADKKFFTGTFDGEIPVSMYVRYIKGNCPDPNGICSWEAIYKFGDQEKYIKLDVNRKPDGSWIFTEDPPIGGMELKFLNKSWTGNWSTADIQTGYDVKMTEAPLSQQQIKTFDDIIQNGKWARGIAKEPGENADGMVEGVDY